MENTNDMTYDLFIETYKPIEDKDGAIKEFDTHDDWGRVKALIDENKIWTVVDGDGSELWAVNGCWFVNRMFYIICEVPYQGERGDIEFEY